MIIFMQKNGITADHSSKLDKIMDLLKLRYYGYDARYLAVMNRDEYHEKVNMIQKLENFMFFLKNGKLIMTLHVFHCSLWVHFIIT